MYVFLLTIYINYSKLGETNPPASGSENDFGLLFIVLRRKKYKVGGPVLSWAKSKAFSSGEI